MTPAIYSYVWRPKFVFWLSLAVVVLATGAVILALTTLSHKRAEQPKQEKQIVTDTLLRAQVKEIFDRVRNIENLAIENQGRINYNTGRIDRLEKK